MSGPEAVKVIIRCRPMNQREKGLKSKVRHKIFFHYFIYIVSILKSGKHNNEVGYFFLNFPVGTFFISVNNDKNTHCTLYCM